ncbi:MAG: rod shape-determining protein RodA [Sphingobacteriales bacterium]|nr:rod shape-determining protein RodA [Sphingobacteriales bacterium]
MAYSNRQQALEASTATDWLLVGLYFLLVCFGLAAILTANYEPMSWDTFNLSEFLDLRIGRQTTWALGSVIVAFLIQLFDNRFFSLSAYLIYGLVLLLLVAVLFLGKEIAGSHSWFDFGFGRFQPSELAKTATALALAKYLSGLNVNIRYLEPKIISAIIIIIPAFLIILQGDMGTALVFSAFLLPLYREGLASIFLILGIIFIALFFGTLFFSQALVNLFVVVVINVFAVSALWYKRREWITIVVASAILLVLSFVVGQEWEIALLVLMGSALVVFFLLYHQLNRPSFGVISLLLATMLYVHSISYIYTSLLKPHQKGRIDVLLGKVDDIKGLGYNLHQSKIAIGAGGLWGKGYLQGLQTQGNFVPELSTDFIFCTIGEEMGFAGSSIFILLYLAFLIRIIFVAERQKSKFSRIYGYGVASIFFFHFLVNIGMTIGILPIIGIPLPLISYGGSSLLSFTILLFLMVRLDARRRDMAH